MAPRVFLHVGLPKTGTTYLQTVMWAHRDELRAQGVLLPGRGRRDHLWASRYWRDLPGTPEETRHWDDGWQRISEDLQGWDGTSVISHEFFSAASAEQAEAVTAALAPAEVHLVVTAREPLSLFTSSWQESLKNRRTLSLDAYSRAPVSESPSAVWNWRSLDVRLVLERWARSLPPERVHVLPVPGAGAPPSLLWDRFAGLIGMDGADFDLSAAEPNASLGAVEAETLRRINRHLPDGALTSGFDRGVYVRGVLADRYLAPRDGDRFWPDERTVAECRNRADEALAAIKDAGYDVVGDLTDLLPPIALEDRRAVADVTDAEVADVAAAVAGDLLQEVRRLTRQRNQLRRQLAHARAEPSLRTALVRRFPLLRRTLT